MLLVPSRKCSRIQFLLVRGMEIKKSGKRLGLIDEHDRDIIQNLIEQPAPIADQTVLIFGGAQVALAFGANEDFK